MTLLANARRTSEMLAARQPVTQDRPARVLVIDDAEVHRMILCKIAVKAGFDAFEAASCGDVVGLTTLNEFECATLDLSLGEAAGTEVLRHFAICGFRAPVIILSGAEPAVGRKAYELGLSLDLNMLEPMGKPVDVALLRKKLAIVDADWQAKRQARSPKA
jgi:DNA-binding response OmpR family regulator